MGEFEMGSSPLKRVLKSLCCCGGWSYGVFWRFDQKNPMLLTFEDAYYEKHIEPLLHNMLLQLHIRVEGVIGSVAKTGKHQWFFSDSMKTGDLFQEDFESLRRFSCGVKTIAIISVGSQGVVEFGGTQKILENAEFLDETRRLLMNTNGLVALDKVPALLSEKDYDLHEWVASLISPANSNNRNVVYGNESNCEDLFYSGLLDEESMCNNGCSNPKPGFSSILSSEGSLLTSFESQLLPSDFWVDEVCYENPESCRSFTNIQNSAPSVNEKLDLSTDISDFCVLDNLSLTSEIFDGNKQKSLLTSPVDNDMLECLGQKFDVSGNLSTVMSECVLGLDFASPSGTRKGLFSELGIVELLDSPRSFDDQMSTTKRRRTESLTFDKTNGLLLKNNTFAKSQVGLWIDDSYSINMTNSFTETSTKKPDEPLKLPKKRARPGESTRPRPKDRQQIQDRLKELRGIIPNSGKCSIDSLLDLTIKHMLFLKSLTEYVDKVKQADKPKLLGQENGVRNCSSGATWAFEVGNQTMVCPIIVEDLNSPGHMLIEMLCEDRGFFLEIADVIRGFGLNILKGVMKIQDDKIWARFVVEANRPVNRKDIFWSLLHLIQETTSGTDPNIRASNIIDSGSSLFSACHSLLPGPIGLQ